MKKKGLLIASRPLAPDGLTKIELDILEYNCNVIDFELACGFTITSEYEVLLHKLGVKFYNLPQKKKVFSYMLAIRRLVKNEKYDFAYIHGNSAMMILEALPAKFARTRVITHCHNTKSDYPIIHYLSKPLFNIIVDTKIGCSKLASRWAYWGKRVTSIVNGIELDKFKYNYYDREAIRNELKWESNTIIGHIGRFSHQKNHQRLIEVFYQYQKDDIQARLLLIGDGKLRADVEKQIASLGIAEKVRIIRYTDVPEKYLSAMDIIVMPSWFEGLCLVALEAQANGLPTLVDTLFSPETLATDNAYALKLEETNEKWAEIIQDMLNKGRKDCVYQLREKGYDKSVMMRKIQEVLTDVL